ncbi:phage portal protein [Phaeovulum vinaykumarii]|uniref:Phage portal protein, lambda family n=1 Tax=Phaeovulum vinaykumarii TaxID=407234 RepID=A0A1N7LR48_9RHOB|nr:phage portal protein [Phaeovulum vinaykumarii]SIS76252.1 Phage portal protein, lambda family [Phaeovulum vinaykumarii]SOC07923.1 lambda family portal protein [Phaeovulum vinaykumarii]
MAARRVMARQAFETLTRGYDGAARGRRTEGWRAPGSSADTEIGVAGALLRDRMRDLVRNNPHAAKAVAVLVNNIIGAGIRLDAASETAWYLAASPNQIDTIEYAYLEGQQGAYIETRNGFDVDGVEIKCRLDFGAKAIDWRGLYKNPGA